MHAQGIPYNTLLPSSLRVPLIIDEFIIIVLVFICRKSRIINYDLTDLCNKNLTKN